MDDVRSFLYRIKLGWRFEEGELRYRNEWRIEEEREKMTGLEKTAEVILATMGEVEGFLKFTPETEDHFDEKRLPTLDFSLWVNKEDYVIYSFYEKPMALNQVIHKNTALSENCKIQSLHNEIMRRLKNCSDRVTWEEKIAVLDRFAQKMFNSGYDEEQIRRVMIGGVKGYERFRKRCEKEKRQIHRSAKESKNVRYIKQLMGKTTWFRKEKKEESDNDTESGEVTADEVEKRFDVRNKLQNENDKVIVNKQGVKTKTFCGKN